MNYLKSSQILIVVISTIFTMSIFTSCKSTKKIQTEISRKDTTAVVITDQSAIDSMLEISHVIDTLKKQQIKFKTFSAKVKVEYEDVKGKQPNITAHIRMVKDSAIWISAIATVFNIEAFRVLITKDSVIVLDKINKLVQRRSIDYLQEVTQIPFTLEVLQNLIVGNPIFFNDSVMSYKKGENQILLSTIDSNFKHLLTITRLDKVLIHSKLDDVNVTRNRTADITYSEFEKNTGVRFATKREITVSEKNKLDIQLDFKQYEFDKEVQISFHVPKNYKPS